MTRPYLPIFGSWWVGVMVENRRIPGHLFVSFVIIRDRFPANYGEMVLNWSTLDGHSKRDGSLLGGLN
jgi:hypothetical protein